MNGSHQTEQWSMYETIAKYLLHNRFSLTALEFYTELLENGVDMPCLRDYFADSNNFEPLTNISSIIDGEIDDTISRILHSDTADSRSIDNVAIYSKEMKNQDGSSSLTTCTTRFYEERISILEWELKKAQKTIEEWRKGVNQGIKMEKTPSTDSTNDKENNEEVPSSSLTGSESMIPSEQRILNYLINQYLLNNNYRYTSVTFAEENDSLDQDLRECLDPEHPIPADLLHLYRWYAYQTELEQHKPTFADVSMHVNFDARLTDQYNDLEKSFEQLKTDFNASKNQIDQLETERGELHQQISSLMHEQKNLILQIQRLEDRSQTNGSDAVESVSEPSSVTESSRQVPLIYRERFQKLVLSDHNADDDRSRSVADRIIEELNQLSLNENALLDLIYRTILQWDLLVVGTKRLEIIPLLICTSILHSNSTNREHLLRILFNLIDEPTTAERQILLHACVILARQSSSIRVQTELFPQLWENLTNESDPRRCLVAEACGRLAVFVPKEMKTSLIFSVLQQMFVEDYSDQIRAIACRNLALVILDMDDTSRLSQYIDILDRCWNDTSIVVQSARDFLVPSIAMWCLELDQLYSMLIERCLTQIETAIQDQSDHEYFLRLMSVLTDLLVFIFASMLKSMPIDDTHPPSSTSPRVLPTVRSSDLYQLSFILSPHGEKLLHYYDQNAMNGEFLFSELMQTSFDSFLTRIFKMMGWIDVEHQRKVHACTDFIQKLSQYFGRNFWQLKIKPIYSGINASNLQSDKFSSTRYVLYATGVLCSWSTEQDKAELIQYLHDSFLLVTEEKLSIKLLEIIYTEVGSDLQLQEHLLTILRDSLMNTNPKIRCYVIRLFHTLLPFVTNSTISQKMLPAMITLASDEDLSVRIATIPVFGSILARSSEPEILERVYSQFQMFDNDATFRTNDHVQNTFVKTFTGICTQIDGKFRDDFLLPLLSFITVQATQPSSNDSDLSKRSELVPNLFDLYNALSRCSNSQSSIFNHLLPGLYCLRGDLAQYRPERLAQLDSIVQELENQLTQHFSSNESNNAQSDSKRGRVLKSLDHLRDSTGKLTYRWMKKK